MSQLTSNRKNYKNDAELSILTNDIIKMKEEIRYNNKIYVIEFSITNSLLESKKYRPLV